MKANPTKSMQKQFTNLCYAVWNQTDCGIALKDKFC